MRKIFLLSAASFILTLFLILAPARAETGSHEGESHDGGGCQMMSSKNQAAVDEIFKNYYSILAALSKDSMENVPTSANALKEAATRFTEGCTKCAKQDSECKQHSLMSGITASAAALAGKKDIASARTEFATLSEKLADYQRQFVKDESARAHVFTCDMAKKVWLQPDEAAGNPYYGPSMAKCKRKVE